MADDSSEYEGLQVFYFDFDEEGRCTHEKFIAPFFDVVSSSNEDFYTYNEQDEVLERIAVRGTEELSKKDKNYISLFGKDSDTTFYRNEYKSDKLIKSIEIGGYENDTLISEYYYEGEVLSKMIHYSIKYKGQLRSENYTEYYQYDKKGRLIEVKSSPETLDSYSIKTIKYKDKKSDLIAEEKIINDFSWRHIYDAGNKTIEVSQDVLNGKIIKNEYDGNNNLTKYTTFFSLDNLGKFGGLAQYVCAAEQSLIKKSNKMTFEEAAAFPQAGVVALQGMRDRKQLKPGYKVLINGAGGGAGTFAIQLAKLYGAEVTGVDNGEKLDLMRSVGADHVFDYRKTDFTKLDLQFDLVLDLVAHRPLYDWKRIMAPESAYALVGGSVKRILHSITLGPVLSKLGNKKMGLLAVKPNQEDMLHLNDLFEAGKIKPVIDQVFTLEETPDAFHILCNGQARGELVVSLH